MWRIVYKQNKCTYILSEIYKSVGRFGVHAAPANSPIPIVQRKLINFARLCNCAVYIATLSAFANLDLKIRYIDVFDVN